MLLMLRALWGNRNERAKKKQTSVAPLNRLPLLPSGPGGIQQELAALICRDKSRAFFPKIKKQALLLFLCLREN
ncbi:hypothetical protein BH24BAC1_BH24BAC1_04790 [soil metagenome]